MAVVRLTHVINKPAEEVFRTVIDVASFPKWNPTIKSARKLSEGGIGEGTKFEFEVRGFGTVALELREFERNRQVKLVPQINGLTGGHRFVFTPQGTGVRVDHELEMTPKGLFRIFAPLMGMMGRKNLQDTADALKAHLEAK